MSLTDALFESDFRLWNYAYVIYALIVLILFLPFVYDVRRRKAFIYYWKFFFYNLILGITATSLNCLFIFRMRDFRNAWLASDVLKPLGRCLGIKWELRGLENIVEGRALVISNHQSSLDILALLEIWRPLGKCAVIGKKELLYLGPFGICAWFCGVLFVDRSNPSKAYKTLEDTKNLLRQEMKLFIYPEGTRNSEVYKTGKLLPFKKGGFLTAISNQIPIVPVINSPYYFIDSEKKYFGRGKIIIKFLPPISTTGLTEEDVGDLMGKAYDIMSRAYEELSEEVVTATLPEDEDMRKPKNL